MGKSQTYLAFVHNIIFSGSVNQAEQPEIQWRHNGRDGVSNHKRHDC